MNCSCVGKLFSHSLQSLVPMRIYTPVQSMRMGTRLCKEWENNFPTQLQFTVCGIWNAIISDLDYEKLMMSTLLWPARCFYYLKPSLVYYTSKRIINPRRVGGELQYLVGLCVCLSVCLLPQNCCLSSIISKSEHATALNLCKELAILLFYKTG